MRTKWTKNQKVNPILPYQICHWKRAKVWDVLVWYCETHKRLRTVQLEDLPITVCSRGVKVGECREDWEIPLVF